MDREKLKADIKEIVEEWKTKEGNLIMILHKIENRYGYVPREVSFEISKLLDVPLARIYEVITFYNYFKLEPPGKHTVAVCMGTACYLKGGAELLSELEHILGVKEDETTKDGLFHLEIVRCLGCCGLAAVIQIDGKVFGELKKNDIIDILSHYTKQNGQMVSGVGSEVSGKP